MENEFSVTAIQKAVIDIAESLGWAATVSGENEWEFYKNSPAGEDFGFEVTANDEEIVDKVGEFAGNFDADDHAEMWIRGRGTNGIPNSIRELIEDAEQIEEMLDELADALEEIAEEEHE